MGRVAIVLSTLAFLTACAQPGGNSDGNKENENSIAAPAPKPAAYCFFQDGETRGWKAKRDRSGNVLVSGQAYREDPRYKAFLSPATIKGDRAEVSPTIGQNDTGFAAPGNWWNLSQAIAGSKDVTSVVVTCGDKTLATLALPRTK